MEVFNLDIHVLDRDFNLVGVVDAYTSVIWRPAYYDIGDFELYLDATVENVNLLQPNYYVVRGQDISVDDEGNTTFKKVMIIKNHNISTDIEGGDYLTVTGRELKYILNSRIVWSQTNLTGNVAKAIETLVNNNAIAPGNAYRVIPNLELDESLIVSDTIEKQLTGDKLDEAITEICMTYDIGYDVYIKNKKLIFKLYKGVDRSTAVPRVVFSEDFENILSSEYTRSTEVYANTTLVGGEGEGSERIYTTVNNTNSGLDRYEVFTDARDISQNKDSEDTIDINTYYKLLAERGLEKLSEHSIIEEITGEVQHDVNYEYGVDYYLGDTVLIINKYGMTKSVKVLSAIESDDENGTKLIPQFNGGA
jgi:hypothetical protein